MKCGECPVFGYEDVRSETGKGRCFCLLKATVSMRPEDECAYGIRDYEEYIRSISIGKGEMKDAGSMG